MEIKIYGTSDFHDDHTTTFSLHKDQIRWLLRVCRLIHIFTGGNPNVVKTYLSFTPELCSRFVSSSHIF